MHSKNGTNELISRTEVVTDFKTTTTTNLWLSGGGGGINWKIRINIYTLLYTNWTTS